MTYKIHAGNNLDILPTLPDNSVDSIVTDPPYELGFMGKKWDNTGIAYSVELWQQCLRVLKPGGHLLSFGGSRTWHRIAVAIEDAGFDVRDSIAWIYATGFPKSLDISKAIDKQAGAEREVLGRNPNSRENATKDNTLYESGTVGKTDYITAASTPEAKQWQGWGTALKPAFEPVIVARKPIEGTVANNVLTYGTGGLNIDGSRIGFRNDSDKDYVQNAKWSSVPNNTYGKFQKQHDGEILDGSESTPDQGRWPANVILDEHTAGLLDEQSGQSKSPVGLITQGGRDGGGFDVGSGNSTRNTKFQGHGDSGGASRFFYVAKASKRDRNEGLDELDTRPNGKMMRNANNTSEQPSEGFERFATQPSQNFHPTVKPTDLMRYLVKLVTPPNGTVLDPFTGSGSTGKAAILEGFDFIGIEMTEEYLPIIEGRLKHAEAKVAERIKEAADQEQEKLF